MQDRYVGDIGDFAKFGLLRSVLCETTDLKLGVHWYKVPDEVHNNDGRHIDYLAARDEFRNCDPELYDALGLIVNAGERSLAAIQNRLILHPGTMYYEVPLTYKDIPAAIRVHRRQEWLHEAYSRLKDADVIFADPDNGLEVKGIDRHAMKGPKFTFYDDLIPFTQSGKSLIIYQHATRQGSFSEQIQRRLDVLRFKLNPYVTQFVVVRFCRVSARAFIFAMTDSHAAVLGRRIEAFISGPWGIHFTQQSDSIG